MRNANDISARPARCKALTDIGRQCRFLCHGLGMSDGRIVYLPVCHVHGTKRFRKGKLRNPGRYGLSANDEQKIVDMLSEWIGKNSRVPNSHSTFDEDEPIIIGGLTWSQFHHVCTAVTRVLPYEISYQECTPDELDIKQRVYAALQQALENVVPNRTDMHAITRRAIRDGRALAFKSRKRQRTT